MVVANQPDIHVVVKQDKKAVVDVATPTKSNINKKGHKKVEKYQELKEELERMWGVKTSVVPMIIGALRDATQKLGGWLQELPRATFEIFVQRLTIIATA